MTILEKYYLSIWFFVSFLTFYFFPEFL